MKKIKQDEEAQGWGPKWRGSAMGSCRGRLGRASSHTTVSPHIVGNQRKSRERRQEERGGWVGKSQFIPDPRPHASLASLENGKLIPEEILLPSHSNTDTQTGRFLFCQSYCA